MNISCKLNLSRAVVLHAVIHALVFALLLSAFALSGLTVHESEGGFGVAIDWARVAGEIPVFYRDNLRSDLFLAFVSAGAFLLSLKTFIVITMKKELFDTEGYREIYDKACQRAGGELGGVYKPLQELNSYIFFAILMSLMCSALQVSLGFVPNVVAVFVCLYFAVCASAYLILSLIYVKKNLDEIIS